MIIDRNEDEIFVKAERYARSQILFRYFILFRRMVLNLIPIKTIIKQKDKKMQYSLIK
jgi:hypothetical protein